MINLGNISLGRLDLGGVRLLASGVNKQGKQELYKQILAKLKKEQPQLFESLVCWYSPNLQGMTNKQLYDAMLVGEYPILRDLSGNGYDMELHGFDGTSASGVDWDGNLQCDGINDYGVSRFQEKPVVMYYATLITDITHVPFAANTTAFSAASHGGMNLDNARMRMVGSPYVNNSALLGNVIDDLNDGISVRTSVRTKSLAEVTEFWLVRPREGIVAYSKFNYRSLILFKKVLTDSEIDWIKTNMLVSQETKKYTINFYYYRDGEPILLTSKKINNGSEIGELPQFDIDSTTCTNEWYYDLTLSEDALVYDDDYVESDLNLYCSTRQIYERMLDELEEIGLRDSLVCMYSPRLQGLTKESVLADATLADLSGNGYDMTLYGFTEDEQIVDENGALVFDGVDDWARNKIDFSADSDWSAYIGYRNNTKNYPIVFGDNNAYVRNLQTRNDKGRNEVYAIQSVTQAKEVNTASFYVARDAVKSSLGNHTISVVSQQIGKYIYVGRLREERTEMANLNLDYLIRFNHSLSETEYTKVKQILKLQ